ncbi:MAG: NYN domain-containing protein, partial [Chlamydiia bacterium]|nr:NYN domain-containing protein [Chlamydiia bacterium]
MRYIIDGYNLFFKLEEDILPLKEKRESFISLLDDKVGNLCLNVTVVFDSHRENSEDVASQKRLKNLEVSFSPKNLSADQYILELLEWNSTNTTLVTSDKKLALLARSKGAKTESIEGFIKFILRRNKR